MRTANEERIRRLCSPYGLEEDAEDRELAKFQHSLKIGQRVVVRHWQSGETHHGEITNIEHGGNLVHVLIDGDGSEDDRRIQCSDDECVPEAFPPGEGRVPNLSAMNPDHEAAQLKAARDRVERYGVSKAGDFLGLTESDDFKLVKAADDAADEHARTVLYLLKVLKGDDVLQKRASEVNGLKEGMCVRDRLGRKGKITKLHTTHAELEFGTGHTGISLLDGLQECAA